MALKPFLAVLFLLPGWFVKRWLERRMKPGEFKDFLLKRRGVEMQARFERQDERLIGAVKGIGARLVGRRPGRGAPR